LSELGVIRWDTQGIMLMSKDIVDIPLDSQARGVYVPVRNQYMLVCSEEAEV